MMPAGRKTTVYHAALFNWMGYTALNIAVVLEIIWKKAVSGCFQVLFQLFEGLAKKNKKKNQHGFKKIMTHFIIGLWIQNAPLEPSSCSRTECVLPTQ